MEHVPAMNGWKTAKLGHVARIEAGGSAPQGDQYFGGPNPFVRVQHLDETSDWVKRWDLITDEAVTKFRLKRYPEGTIVLPKSGASIRLEKRARLTVDSYLVSHLAAITPKSHDMDAGFLFYALRAARLAKEKTDGYPTLNLTELAEVQVPLPPCDEQRAIASVLGTVRRAQEACEHVIAGARQLKASTYRHLFTYGSVPVGEASQVTLKDTEIGPLPSHWEVRRLGDVCSVDWGNTNLTKASYSPTGYTAFSATGPDGVMPTYEHDGAGVVVSAIGARCGKCFWAEGKWTAIKNTIVIKARSSDMDLRFLLPFLDDERLWPRSGSGQPFIGIGKAAKVLVPYPPAAEQSEIAEILSAIDEKVGTEESRRAALEGLFDSMLHHLMTGAVRLPEFVTELP